MEVCSKASEDENLIFNSHSKLFIAAFLSLMPVPVSLSYLNNSLMTTWWLGIQQIYTEES